MIRTPKLCISKLGLWAVLLIMLQSCGSVERPTKPSASGRAGELLAVMDQRLWDSPVGQTFRDVFRDTVPMLNQVEPMFNVIHLTTSNFAKIFETHRHIFFLDLDETKSSPSIEITRDVWSYPQLVVRVTAPDYQSAMRILQNNAETFHNRYLEVERLRLIEAYRRMANRTSQGVVREKFDLEMVIPDGYFPAVQGEDFVWLRKTATNEEFDQGLMIWSLDYTDPAVDFDPDVIWARRDSITKLYIPGQFPGTYMTTHNKGRYRIPPMNREIDFNGKYAMESRSLWTMEGDFMGGPFITYTFVDDRTDRLIMMDAWVFAPAYPKRDYLRQVEAIIWSVKFPENENQADQQH